MTQVIPQTPPDYDSTRVIERPDGFYWQEKPKSRQEKPKSRQEKPTSRQDEDYGREHGPFATLLEAVEDMEAAENGAPEPGETLEEAEAEIGIATWIDPETGAPAEEERPHIDDE